MIAEERLNEMQKEFNAENGYKAHGVWRENLTQEEWILVNEWTKRRIAQRRHSGKPKELWDMG